MFSFIAFTPSQSVTVSSFQMFTRRCILNGKTILRLQNISGLLPSLIFLKVTNRRRNLRLGTIGVLYKTTPVIIETLKKKTHPSKQSFLFY